jgi:hypothetical protein
MESARLDPEPVRIHAAANRCVALAMRLRTRRAGRVDANGIDCKNHGRFEDGKRLATIAAVRRVRLQGGIIFAWPDLAGTAPLPVVLADGRRQPS